MSLAQAAVIVRRSAGRWRGTGSLYNGLSAESKRTFRPLRHDYGETCK